MKTFTTGLSIGLLATVGVHAALAQKPGQFRDSAPPTDVGAETATHREVKPLAIAFRRLSALKLDPAGRLVCLDLAERLKTCWQVDAEPLADYCSLIAGKGRVLVTTQRGELCLLQADKRRFHQVSRLDLFKDVPAADRDVWSHPAVVDNRLYIRNSLAVYCFLF